MELKSGYKKTEVGMIPDEWDCNLLLGRISISHGFALQSCYFCDCGPYILTTPGHFYEQGGFRDVGEKQKYYSGPVSDKQKLQPNDLIVAMTEQADGLLGSAAFIPEVGTYLHNQRLGKIRLISMELDVAFIYYLFNSSRFRSGVRETAAGTKVKHTSPAKLLDIDVPLPPIAEQRAIAAALSDADALIGSLDKLIAKKRNIKQAAMQHLLAGKRRLQGFMSEWDVKTLGKIAELKKGQLITEKDAMPGSIPVIAGGKKPSYFHNCSNRIGKSITVSASGASAGYVAFFDIPIFASDCSTIGESKHYCIEFLYFQLQWMQEKIYRAQTGGAQPHIYPAHLAQLEIALPTVPEQQAIATVLSDMDAEIAALEKKRDKTRLIKQGMMQELLTGRKRLI